MLVNPTEEDVGGVCLSFAQFELLSGHKKAAFHWLLAHLLCTVSYFCRIVVEPVECHLSEFTSLSAYNFSLM